METSSSQREILLVTNNSFARREWCKKGNLLSDNLSSQEKMEELCANGLIKEILPELFASTANKKLYLWQMQPGFSFLQFEYGEFPVTADEFTSINPNNFLPVAFYN